jgi:two-component system, LuxR family, sensor kinase FixL
MKTTEFWHRWLLSRPKEVLIAASLLTLAIAGTDWLVVEHYSIGFLYIFPIIIASSFLRRWQIVVFAVVCGSLRELLSPFFGDPDWLPRLATISFGFLGTGLFVSELSRNRTSALNHVCELSAEFKMRIVAQQRLTAIVESSLAPILTIDSEGKVLLANRAAHELLGWGESSLLGQSIYPHIPEIAALSRVGRVRHAIRTFMEGTGYRQNGEAFLAHMWISNVGSAGGEIAIILFDVSEQLREREDAHLHRLLAQSRILLAGFWHEVRNLCGAMNLVQANLKRIPSLAANPDLQTLATLVDALTRFASAELHPVPEEPRASVDLRSVLTQLRVIVEPWFQEVDSRTHWAIPADLPLVVGDHHGLLQIFLNLARNARRAIMDADRREFCTIASTQDECVIVRFVDTGAGIRDPDALFKPFRSGNGTTGMGLYISRAVARSFGGDVRHEAAAAGACFAVHLNIFQNEGDPT